jgi:hypothetical protein
LTNCLGFQPRLVFPPTTTYTAFIKIPSKNKVKELKNLGYTFNERAKKIVRKVNKVVGCVWEIEERKWGDDFRMMMMMR